MFTCCMKRTSVEKVVNLRIRKPIEKICEPEQNSVVEYEQKPIENLCEPVTEQIIFVDNNTNPYIKTPVSFIKTPIEENNIKKLPPLPPSPKTPIE